MRIEIRYRSEWVYVCVVILISSHSNHLNPPCDRKAYTENDLSLVNWRCYVCNGISQIVCSIIRFDLIRFVSFRFDSTFTTYIYTVFINFVSRVQNKERERDREGREKNQREWRLFMTPWTIHSLLLLQCEQENVAWSGVKYTHNAYVQYLYEYNIILYSICNRFNDEQLKFSVK